MHINLLTSPSQAKDSGRWVITTTKASMDTGSGIIATFRRVEDPTDDNLQWMTYDGVARRWQLG